MRYAARTKVPVAKTRGEIEQVVKKYGATGFVAGWQDLNVRVEFILKKRHVRISMIEPLPEAEKRQKWRALLLMVKAKLEAVDAKILTFDEAFLADIVMSDGKTVWERVREPIALEYESGRARLLLGSQPQ